VEEAVKATGANASVIFVPAPFAGDAIMEASFAGVELVICITEGVPVQDMIKVTPVLKQNGTKMIGANCPGLITVDECLIGILPGMIFKKGNVGLISRSGTLTYEVVDMLTQSGLGQTTCVGIGGDSVSGLYFKDLLEMYENDPETEAVVLIGEIGGDAEEQAAQYIKDNMTKPVVAFIAGQSAPPGKRMGHAGAIISSGAGTAEEKIKAFAAAGVPVAKEPGEIPGLVKEKLGL
ncbi:MAG: succinate--CoA ligase subunit alpha, partial [Prolixibacteraceae bacterium]|nr:succinate--CoA ligase subunit alpha [Prolixibacteraceae bacterium]